MMKRANNVILAGLLVIALAGWFLFSTVLADEIPDALLVAGAALGCAALSAAAGLPHRADVASLTTPDVLATAAAGILALVVAPALVLANRYTDAPPGSEVLFFTTAAWGALALVAALGSPSDRARLAQVPYALAGLLGSATLVANWERPSSFSPFVRYPDSHAAFLVAGLAWMVATLVIVRQARRSPSAAPVIASAAGSAASVLWAVVSVPSLATLAPNAALFLSAALCGAVSFVAWVRLCGDDFTGPSGLWFLVPVAVLGFGVFEQVVSPRGPDPVVWAGASGGIVLCVIGAIGVAAAGRRAAAAPRSSGASDVGDDPPAMSQERGRRVWLGASLVAVVALVLALIALVQPTLGATARGTSESGAYRATWDLLGYEAAAGWLAVVVASMVLAAAIDTLRRGVSRSALAQAALGAALVACYPLVVSSPLRTWNRWVPVAVQTEYGTEYASLRFEVLHDPVRLTAMALAVISAAILLMGYVIFSRQGMQSVESPGEPS